MSGDSKQKKSPNKYVSFTTNACGVGGGAHHPKDIFYVSLSYITLL